MKKKLLLVTILMLTILSTSCYSAEKDTKLAQGEIVSAFEQRESQEKENLEYVSSNEQETEKKELKKPVLSMLVQEESVKRKLCDEYDGKYWEYVCELDAKYYDAILRIISSYDPASDNLKDSEQQKNNIKGFYNYNILISNIVDGKFKVLLKEKGEENFEVEEYARYGNDDIGGLNHWNYMYIFGIDMEKYDKSMETLQETYYETLYNIVKVDKDESSNTFNVLIETAVYAVIGEDTLSEIAQQKHTTVEEILKLNPNIENPDLIYPADFLKIR